MWRLCKLYSPPSLCSLVTVIIWSLWTRLIARPLTSPCFPFPRTRRAVNRFILFFNFLFLSNGQFRRRNRLFGVIIASSVFWLRNMIVFGTSKQCFQAEMIQKCVFIFFSLFTKVVGIHLSNFFNDGSFKFPENIFFTCYFLGPSGTSMSDFMSFVCISVYWEYLFFFAMVQRHWKKKIDKNRWNSGQKNSKMSQISMKNCVGSLGFDCHISIYSHSAPFFYDGRMPKDI